MASAEDLEARQDAVVDGPNALSLDPVIAEAMKRWRRCSEWEGTARERFIDDIKFRHGDSENGYQWPNSIRQQRDFDNKPCLTMNNIRQHNLQVSNNLKKNKSEIKIVGTGGGATGETARVVQDLCRHVENNSVAQDVYTVGRDFMIDGGYGAWRIVTDYAHDETFDQEIYLLPIVDPLTVYMDPDAQKKDKSDGKFAFVFDTLPREQFLEIFPKYANQATQQPLGVSSTDDDWVTRDHVRVCEYFRKVEEPDELVSFLHMGDRHTIRRSLLPEEGQEALLSHPQTRTRPTKTTKVEWYLIAGEVVIDQTIWHTSDIPIIILVGEETVIDGILDRKGHTRAMKDAQRMYNYNTSAQVEYVALQGKTPWVAAAEAIEELEQYWNTANSANHSVLPFNAYDDEGNKIPPPARTEPPNNSPAYQAGMDTAFNQMMMTSGQWQNQMGMQGNERTGAAIGKRQEQADTAVFHFQDNYEGALQATGRQLIKLIPKVYDTKRIKQVVGDDGVDYELVIDPAVREGYLEQQGEQGKVIRRVFNPTLGSYDVAASFGPAYSSKREATQEALTLILTQSPDLIPLIGDLLFASMDFDKAQEAAQRMKRMVPPAALGTGPSASEQHLTQVVQSLQAELAKSLQEQAKLQLKLVGKDEMRDIDVYEAETKRIAALKDALFGDPKALHALIADTVTDALQRTLESIPQENQSTLSSGETP